MVSFPEQVINNKLNDWHKFLCPKVESRAFRVVCYFLSPLSDLFVVKRSRKDVGGKGLRAPSTGGICIPSV